MPVALALAAIVVLAAATRRTPARPAAPPATTPPVTPPPTEAPPTTYVWNPVPATAAGSPAVSSDVITTALNNPLKTYVSFPMMSTPTQFTAGSQVKIAVADGEVIGYSIDGMGKRYLDVRIMRVLPLSDAYTIEAQPAAGTIARINDEHVLSAVHLDPASTAVEDENGVVAGAYVGRGGGGHGGGRGGRGGRGYAGFPYGYAHAYPSGGQWWWNGYQWVWLPA